ncbi:MAG TPA: hypothetical protein VLR27_07815 [Acidimicrobiales bacterium]|nr:hypothetical protein [Acidimicrobiales bacterium]
MAAACAAASQLIGLGVAALSPLVVAVVLGALVANLGRHRSMLAIAVRTAGIIPDRALEAIRAGEVLIFVLALAGLGMGVHAGQLRTLGTRPLLFGLVAWLVIGAAAYGGLRLLTP